MAQKSTQVAAVEHRGALPDAAVAALERYLVEQGVLAPGGALQVSRLDGGRSNLTYVVTDGASRWVLRSPPRAGVVPSAHDIVREHRVMHALASTDVPVPRMFALCEDPAVLGVPFSLMEWIDGPVWRAPADAADAAIDQRRLACLALVDTLAALHGADAGALDLPGRGDGTGYLERQVRRWSDQWERWADREVPAVDALRTTLLTRLPRSSTTSVVHGDYRFDNVVLAVGERPRVRAVLDWELSAVGDPLADLGSLVAFWGHPYVTPVLAHQELTRLPGFLTSSQVVARYDEQTGGTVHDLGFYVAFGCFRWAVIREGIRARSRLNGGDAGNDPISASVPMIAARGLAVLEDEGAL